MPHNSPDVHKVRDSIRRALASVQDHAYAALGWAAIEAYSRVTHVRGGALSKLYLRGESAEEKSMFTK